MLRVAACAVVLAGCDVLFGLGHVTPIDADLTDAPPVPLIVTGSYKQIYVANGSDGLPVVAERVFPTDQIVFAAVLDDGTSVEVDYQPDGTFSFPIARIGQPYQFSYIVEGARGEVQTDTSQLRIGSMVAGRPDRRPVAQSTVQFSYPLSDGTNYGVHIASTGVYTFTGTNTFGPTVNFDWRLSTAGSGGAVGLLEASKHDRLYLFEPSIDNSVPTLPYASYRSVSSAAVTQVAGGTVTPASPSPVAKNGCVRFAATNGLEYARITAAHPRAYVDTSADWIVYSAPAAERVGIVGAHWVALCGYKPVRDIDIAPTFHDPFPGTTLVIESAAIALFEIRLGTSTPLQQLNITRRFRPIERGTPAACMPTKTTLDTDVALLGAFTLDGIPLDSDGKVVALDLSRDVRLQWQIVAPGKLEFVTVSLQEVQIVNGATALIPRANVATANVPYAVIDRALLVPGSKYIFAVTSSVGRPNVQNGDWETLQMPFENASVWSYYFEVQ